MDADALTDALVYPWNGGESGTTLVLGGLLTLLSPLIAPGLVVLGFGMQVIAAVLAGEPDPPTFDGWRRLIVLGLKAAVVLLVYVVIPLAVGTAVLAAILGLGGFRFGRGVPTPGGLVGVGGIGLAFGLSLSVLVLVFWYLVPAALVQLARTRRLGAAFDFGVVQSLIETDGYASAWLLALVVFAASNVVVAVLNVASAGVVLAGFVIFYAFLVATFLFARGASEAGVEAGEADGGPTEPGTGSANPDHLG